MATFRRRNDKWHVQIRRKDYPSQTKSFQLKLFLINMHQENLNLLLMEM